MLWKESGVLTFIAFLGAVSQVGGGRGGGGAAVSEGFCEAGVQGCEVRN